MDPYEPAQIIQTDTDVKDLKIKVEEEGHTIGSLLRTYILKDPDIVFAAYKVNNPLESNFELRAISKEPNVNSILLNQLEVINAQLNDFEKLLK